MKKLIKFLRDTRRPYPAEGVPAPAVPAAPTAPVPPVAPIRAVRPVAPQPWASRDGGGRDGGADRKMVSLAKTAGVSLSKAGWPAGQRAAVYLVLDHSGSMDRWYGNHAVQHLAERVLGLSLNLDDDGSVPTVFFGDHASAFFDVDLNNYHGIVDRQHQRQQWGGTNYLAALDAVEGDYRSCRATDPAFVIFQTDGEPTVPQEQIAARIAKLADKPIFWQFIGFGADFPFLRRLADEPNRLTPNVGFFPVGNVRSLTDTELYDQLTKDFPRWLAEARRKGIVR